MITTSVGLLINIIIMCTYVKLKSSRNVEFRLTTIFNKVIKIYYFKFNVFFLFNEKLVIFAIFGTYISKCLHLPRQFHIYLRFYSLTLL